MLPSMQFKPQVVFPACETGLPEAWILSCLTSNNCGIGRLVYVCRQDADLSLSLPVYNYWRRHLLEKIKKFDSVQYYFYKNVLMSSVKEVLCNCFSLLRAGAQCCLPLILMYNVLLCLLTSPDLSENVDKVYLLFNCLRPGPLCR